MIASSVDRVSESSPQCQHTQQPIIIIVIIIIVIIIIVIIIIVIIIIVIIIIVIIIIVIKITFLARPASIGLQPEGSQGQASLFCSVPGWAFLQIYRLAFSRYFQLIILIIFKIFSTYHSYHSHIIFKIFLIIIIILSS